MNGHPSRIRARRHFLLGSLTLGAAALAGCGEKPPYSAIGKPFPGFRLRDIDGVERALADYHGMALIANFWATWCPPCRSEMPELDRVHRRHAADGLRVIGFSIDEDVNAVREFRLRVPVSFPLLLDAGQQLAKHIGINSFPTTLLVGKDGFTREVVVGPRAWLEYPGVLALL